MSEFEKNIIEKYGYDYHYIYKLYEKYRIKHNINIEHTRDFQISYISFEEDGDLTISKQLMDSFCDELIMVNIKSFCKTLGDEYNGNCYAVMFPFCEIYERKMIGNNTTIFKIGN